jgi:hypothetical protein
MPTIVNRIVRYTGGTDTTLASAIAAIPANLVTVDQQWNILIDESAAGVYEWDLGGYGPTLSGITTDATRYVRIAANTGKGFTDNANKLTNALTYNPSNGAALRAGNVVINSSIAFLRIDGLQFLRTASTPNIGEAVITIGGASSTIKNCIIKSNSTIRYSLRATGLSSLIANVLLLTGSDGLALEFGGVQIANVTVARTSGSGGSALISDYGPPTVKNFAAFGFSAVLGGSDTSFNAASSNNVTDLASGPTNWGTGSLLGRTFANQFQSITNGSEDFRVKAGADLIGAGVRDQTYTSDLDIVGSARSTTTPTIGAWEFPSVTYTYARPTSDITTQWSPSTGTDHFALIDETTANDADYIYATAAGQTDEVRLASMSAPQAGTDLLINYKVAGIVGSASVTMSLRQGSGGTLIATDTAKTSDNTYQLVVPAATWSSSVTDWTDLRLRFVSA